jgi:hypothetical protein
MGDDNLLPRRGWTEWVVEIHVQVAFFEEVSVIQHPRTVCLIINRTWRTAGQIWIVPGVLGVGPPRRKLWYVVWGRWPGVK